jgi:hypothetical protein
VVGDMTKTWTCKICGKVHEGIADSYGYDAPWQWYSIPKAERAKRAFLNQDYCVIDETDFFVRGCIEIPILGALEPFLWGVWVSLNKSNFEREQKLVKDPKRSDEPAYFGWLCTRIEIYPDTAGLMTDVHTRRVGLRPLVRVQRSEHPLSLEQRNGISMDRVLDIAEKMHHGWKHPAWCVGPPDGRDGLSG